MNANSNQQIRINGVQYRLQYRRCGKPGCKCNTGQGHGPYWYSYDGNSAAKYVGAKLPESVIAHVELLQKSGPRLKAIKAKVTKQRDEAYQEYLRHDRELTALRNLEAGEYTASEILKQLGLAQFNGQGK